MSARLTVNGRAREWQACNGRAPAQQFPGGTMFPQSPCIGACLYNPGCDICLGCLRTWTEVLEWKDYTYKQKTKLLEELIARKAEQKERKRQLSLDNLI